LRWHRCARCSTVAAARRRRCPVLFHTRAARPSTDTRCVGRRGHHRGRTDLSPAAASNDGRCHRSPPLMAPGRRRDSISRHNERGPTGDRAWARPCRRNREGNSNPWRLATRAWSASARRSLPVDATRRVVLRREPARRPRRSVRKPRRSAQGAFGRWRYRRVQREVRAPALVLESTCRSSGLGDRLRVCPIAQGCAGEASPGRPVLAVMARRSAGTPRRCRAALCATDGRHPGVRPWLASCTRDHAARRSRASARLAWLGDLRVHRHDHCRGRGPWGSRSSTRVTSRDARGTHASRCSPAGH